MAASPRGLGKGLDALLKGYSPSGEVQAEVQLLPLEAIVPAPDQPRQDFNAHTLQELAQSIKTQGVLQPILVRPAQGAPGRYQIVAGERRWRASGLAGLSSIPALVRKISDDDALAIALIENLQREDLNPIEEAEALARLKHKLNLHQDELAHRVGKSRPAVANSLRLLKLEDPARESIREGRLSAGHGRALLAVEPGEVRDLLFRHALDKGLSVREIEHLVTRWKETGRLPGILARKSGRAAARHAKGFARSLQSRLAKAVTAKVRITGDATQGRITLSYRSGDELTSLLTRLGCRDDNVSCETSAEA